MIISFTYGTLLTFYYGSVRGQLKTHLNFCVGTKPTRIIILNLITTLPGYIFLILVWSTSVMKMLLRWKCFVKSQLLSTHILIFFCDAIELVDMHYRHSLLWFIERHLILHPMNILLLNLHTISGTENNSQSDGLTGSRSFEDWAIMTMVRAVLLSIEGD